MGLRTILRIFSILVLMGLVAGLDCKAQEIDKDLALYLNFEEGSGEAVKDQSPNGYLGKAYGGPVWVEGVKGKAMEFDGKDDYLLLKEEKLDISNTPFTISLWVKPAKEQAARHRIFLINDRDWEASYSLGVDFFTIPKPKPFKLYYMPAFDVWQNVVVTYDPFGEEPLYAIFVNGEVFTENSYREKLVPDKELKGRVVIGAGETVPYYVDGHFKGAVDEFKIYRRVLSEKEVKDEYKKYTPKK